MRKRRRTAGLVGGVAVSAVILMAMGSAAFACTTYQGKMTVTAGGGTSISQGDDNCGGTGGCGAPDGSMSFCSVSFGATLAGGTSGQTISVAMAKTDDCTGTGQQENQLANGTYDINWINTNAMKSTDLTIDTNEDCMSWNGGSITHLSTTATISNGVLSGGSNLHPPAGTTNTNGYSAAVCVSDQGSTSNYGNEAPLTYT